MADPRRPKRRKRVAADPRRAKRRKHYAAHPELITETLAQPVADAVAAVALTRELAPDVGALRTVMAIHHELRLAVNSLAGFRNDETRKARRLMRELRSYIDRPDGLAMFPHLRYTPRTVTPWVNWKLHLATLMVKRPEWRKGIEQDWTWLKAREAEAVAAREVGTYLPAAMPRKVVALLQEAARLAPHLDLKQRAEAHRGLQHLLIAGCWQPHPAERVLRTLVPPELYGMLPMGSA